MKSSILEPLSWSLEWFGIRGLLCSCSPKYEFEYFTLERCLLKDKDLYGHDLKIKKLPSPEECQRWCQETKECEMFVYATKTFGTDAYHHHHHLFI